MKWDGGGGPDDGDALRRLFLTSPMGAEEGDQLLRVAVGGDGGLSVHTGSKSFEVVVRWCRDRGSW